MKPPEASANRVGREQRQQRLIHLGRHHKLVRARPEVRDVIRLIGKVRWKQRDCVSEQLRQDGRKRRDLREASCGNRPQHDAEHDSMESRRVSS